MGHLAGKRCGRAGCACVGLSLACVLLLMLISLLLPVLPELLGNCQGDRKGPRPYYDPLLCDTPLVLIVRAGAVWSGVGTLAVALGGKRATLTPSSLCGRPGVARPARYT